MYPQTMFSIALKVMLCLWTTNALTDTTKPISKADLVFEEKDGIVAVEAEHFYKQGLTEKRAWHICSSENAPEIKPDPDPVHTAGASGGAYLEILPDTRANHGQKLIQEENFSDKPGIIAVLSYKVHFNTPGRYYVWIRCFSTGSEDNGVHVGLNGQWPASGQRWQTVHKNKWAWECKQRTPEVHTGVPMQLFLDIEKAGEHEIMISMREDGFELDKFVLALDKEFKPKGKGPDVQVKSGSLPKPFQDVEEEAVEEIADQVAVKKTKRAPADQATKLALEKVVADTPDSSRIAGPDRVQPRQQDGMGNIAISGELKQWHKVTLTLDGPFAHERDNLPNAFTDLAFNVTFTHQSGSPSYRVPGYFATDGDAANSSAESGTKWRAHLSPDKTGIWNYTVSFTRGKHSALDGGGEVFKPFDGVKGTFEIAPTDKTGRDFRARGRLQYVGKRYLQFAGSKEYFFKAGPDSPETLLAFVDFDNTTGGKPNKAPLKSFEPHVSDWTSGDPTWRNGKGKGLIGALNYLAGKGLNSFSFLTYNAAGDGDNVWPFVQRDAKLNYDCSKLDQWGIVFDHATNHGLYLHFKLQENEMDDNRLGTDRKAGVVTESLDGGKLGPERKLYCRELIARFGHALALNWNIGEENTQSSDEIREMAKYLHENDPYHHNIVVHTFPQQQDAVYTPLLGDQSLLTGVSVQNSWHQVHRRTLHWINRSKAAGRAWVVPNDEQNPASLGIPCDPGYQGHDGVAQEKKPLGAAAEGFVASKPYSLHDIRKLTLWGNLMAGGAGVEYYFGYQLPENDLLMQDFRSRDKSWDYCRIAIDFLSTNQIPLSEMVNADLLVGNPKNDNSKFCLAKSGEVYLVYLPNGGSTELDLTDVNGDFTVTWFNPRRGGDLIVSDIKQVRGGSFVKLGTPPEDVDQDWAIIVKK